MSTDVVDQNHQGILDLIIKVNAEVNGKVLTYQEAYAVLCSFDYETFLDISGSHGDLVSTEMTLRHLLTQTGKSTADVLSEDRLVLAKNLKKLMEQKELTALQLANKSAVAIGTLKRVLEGGTVDFGIYQRIIQALDRKFLFVQVKEFVHRAVNGGIVYYDTPPDRWEMIVENFTWPVFRRVVTSSNGMSPQFKYKATCELVKVYQDEDIVTVKGKAVKDIIDKGFYSLLVVKPTAEQYEKIKSIGLVHSGTQVLTVKTGTQEYKVTAGALISPEGARLKIPLELTPGGDRVKDVKLTIDWDGEELVPGQTITVKYDTVKLYDTYEEAIGDLVDPMEELLSTIKNMVMDSPFTEEKVRAQLLIDMGREGYKHVTHVIDAGSNKYEIVVEMDGVKRSKIITVSETPLTPDEEADLIIENAEKTLLADTFVLETFSVENMLAAAKKSLGNQSNVAKSVEDGDAAGKYKVTLEAIVEETTKTKVVDVVATSKEVEAGKLIEELEGKVTEASPIKADSFEVVDIVTALNEIEHPIDTSFRAVEKGDAEGTYKVTLAATYQDSEFTKEITITGVVSRKAIFDARTLVLDTKIKGLTVEFTAVSSNINNNKVIETELRKKLEEDESTDLKSVQGERVANNWFYTPVYSITVEEKVIEKQSTQEIKTLNSNDTADVTKCNKDIDTKFNNKVYETFVKGTTVENELKGMLTHGATVKVKTVEDIVPDGSDFATPMKYKYTVESSKYTAKAETTFTVSHDNETLKSDRKVNHIISLIPAEVSVATPADEAKVKAAVVATITAAGDDSNITAVTDNSDGTWKVEVTDGTVVKYKSVKVNES